MGGGGRLAIDEQPVHAELADNILELSEVDGFLDMAVRSEPITADHVSFLFGGGEHDHRNGSRAYVAFHFFQHLQAVYFGEFEIEQNQVRGLLKLAVGKLSPAE